MEKLKNFFIFIFIGIPVVLIISLPFVMVIALFQNNTKPYFERIKTIYTHLLEKLIFIAR